jgi:hypothetical protein
MIVDFGEEKRIRQRYAALDALFVEAHQAFRNLRLTAEGAFIVIKSPGADDKPYYQFVQEGISSAEIADILKRITTPLTLPE